MGGILEKEMVGEIIERYIFGFGSMAVLCLGVYFLIKGDITNALLAFILTCVAYNLDFQIGISQIVRLNALEILKKKPGETE